jgi:hydroxypyruvate isomerase
MPLKQSVCIPMLNQANIPMEEFVPAVAAMGYPAVEIWQIDEHLERFAALCHSHHLVISQIVGHGSLPVGLNDPAQHARIEAELRDSIDVAVRYGVPGLICFSGNRRPGQSEEDAIVATVAGFKRIAPYAEEKGINLNLELLNTLVDHPGYQNDHSTWGLEVCKRVNSPRVKLLYDIYHMQIMEGNLISTISENIQWIGHFHTAGVPGRRDIDEMQEINYRAVCQAINVAGYDLYLAHEYVPKGDVFQSLRKAFEICSI